MIFREKFPLQAEMSELETVFRSLWKEHPDLELALPHPQEYYTEILKLADKRTSHPFPRLLLNTRLDEAAFFRESFDTERTFSEQYHQCFLYHPPAQPWFRCHCAGD